ncbi:MAG: acetoin utilization protein AcuC [Armatimonadota bacterium]
MAPFLYTNQLEQYQFSESHPLKPMRLRLMMELMEAYGLFESALQLKAPSLSEEQVTAEILRVHTPRYVEMVKIISTGEPVMDMHRWGFSPFGDNPPFIGMWEAALAYVSATVEAAYAVRDGELLAFSMGGGLHHALPDRASGFCVFNDPAIAIVILRERFERVAYLDIDLHHGDGVQWIFYRDPTVLTVSIHEGGRWLFPGTGFANELGEGEAWGTSINIPLAPETDDEIWWWAFQQVVPRAFERFQPDALVLQMGADPHYLDPLGHLNLTAQGWLRAVEWARSLGLPTVALGGGGYNLTTVPRMWTLAVATLAGVELPDETPPQFRWHDRIPTLTDHEPPKIAASDLDYARRYAEQQVAFLLNALNRE